VFAWRIALIKKGTKKPAGAHTRPAGKEAYVANVSAPTGSRKNFPDAFSLRKQKKHTTGPLKISSGYGVKNLADKKIGTDPKERLIFALDAPSRYEAEKFVGELDGTVDFFKVGIILHTSAGPDFISYLLKKGKKVFLDLKFFDIGETVRDAVRCAADSGVDFLTVHAVRQVVESAVEGAASSKLKILAVTLLTSLGTRDLQESGTGMKAENLVLLRAKIAQEAGCAGIITSGKEIASIRKTVGNNLLVVTPGVRPQGTSTDGHKRFVTPFEAIKAGADYLVVGRPIKNAGNPREAALKIIGEMDEALNRS